jgi:hypothetical protein
MQSFNMGSRFGGTFWLAECSFIHAIASASLSSAVLPASLLSAAWSFAGGEAVSVGSDVGFGF